MDVEEEFDGDSALYQAIAGEAAKTEKEEVSAIDSLAAGLDELIGDLAGADLSTGNELIGEGEEL